MSVCWTFHLGLGDHTMFKWLWSTGRSQLRPGEPKSLDDIHKYIAYYRTRREQGRATPEEARQFSFLVCALPHSYSYEVPYQSHVFSIDDHAVLYQEAIDAAFVSGDRDRLLSTLNWAIDFARRLNRYEDAYHFAKQNLPVTLQGPTQTLAAEGKTATDLGEAGYGYLVWACSKTKRHDEAIEIGFKAIPNYDPRSDVLLHFLIVISDLWTQGNKQMALVSTSRAAEQFITNDDSPAARIRSSMTHRFLAEAGATWQGSPLFSLDAAQDHARQAWSLNPKPDNIASAAVWWAICELRQRGSADQIIQPQFSDGSLYDRVIEQGRSELRRLAIA